MKPQLHALSFPLVLVVVATTIPAPAQELLAPQEPQSWGISRESAKAYPAVGFVPRFNTSANPAYWDYSESGTARYRLSGSFDYDHPVDLPGGALITRIEADACDSSTTYFLHFILWQCSRQLQTCLGWGYVKDPTNSPGCSQFLSADLTANNIVVANGMYTYYLSVRTDAPNADVRWRSVRLFYKLQVSPAPITATFPNDVPTTHPFYRYIEALAAAGITGGCAPGSFCPDTAVTRGQMAVFLAGALGLYYPN